MKPLDPTPEGPLQLVLARLDKVRRSGSNWRALCPAHEDRKPSLSVSEGEDGRALLKCHAGCSTEEVTTALGLRQADLFMKRNLGSATSRRIEVAVYDYLDKTGELKYQVVRYNPKDFRQRRPDPNGGWTWNLKGVQRLPYRLPELLTSAEDRRVFIVEGEKDSDRLASIGEIATCNAGGAGKWQNDWAEYFARRECVIIADNDSPGLSHASTIYRSIESVAAQVLICRAASGSDVCDHLDAGLSLDDLEILDPSEFEPVPVVPVVPNSHGGNESVAWELLETLLDDIEAFIAKYVVFQEVHHRVAMTLWVCHAHCIEAVDSTPRLAALSPEPGSGKSRVLELLNLLTPNAVHAASISAAAIFRIIEKEPVTFLLDEADTYLGVHTASHHEEIRALVNAGHGRGAKAIRCVGEGTKTEGKKFSAFCPVALAGLGKLPDTIMDRAIILPMRRRRPDEHVERFRSRIVTPIGHALRDRLDAWSNTNCARLGGTFPDMPSCIADRPADVWEPLIAIAAAASPRWLERGLAACLSMSTISANRESSRGVRLLGDIRAIFASDDPEAIPSSELLASLCAIEDAPWSDIRGRPLTSQYLAKLLREYEISPQQLRRGTDVIRCYVAADFSDAWTRYLLPLRSTNTDSSEPGTSGTSGTDEPSATFDANLLGGAG